MPNIVRDELLDGTAPVRPQITLILNILEFLNQSINILNEDVIASDQHSFLIL